MKPVGVCRACLVEVTTKTPDGRTRTEMAPACYLPVTNNAEVKTLKTSPRVAKTVRTVIELLLSDYQRPTAAGVDFTANELAARRRSRVDPGSPRPFPAHAPHARQRRLLPDHRRRPQRLHPLRPLHSRVQRDPPQPRHQPSGQRF